MLLGAALLVPATLLAVTMPHTFQPGTAVRASEVNANFTAITNAVTTLEGNVGAIQTNATAIAGLQRDLGALRGELSAATTRLSALEGALAKCNWEGKKYVSHGSDNANAWSAGARLTCRNGKLVEVRWANCGIPERGNPCGWND